MSQLHIIEPDAFIRGAMLRAAQKMPDIDLGIVGYRWLALHDWGFGADVVVLRARMFDIWPIIIKVAALKRLDCRVIVLIDPATPQAVARLREAGAWAVVCDSELSSPAAVIQLARQALHDAARSAANDAASPDATGVTVRAARKAAPSAGPSAPVPLADLLDRPLQVACLYASAPAPSAKEIGHVLGIAESTVRGHLDRVRVSYRRAGIDLPDRATMRSQLRADGLRIGESGWQ